MDYMPGNPPRLSNDGRRLRRIRPGLGAAAALGLGFGLTGAGSAQAAASAEDAQGFVAGMVDEVTQLVQSGKPIEAQAEDFSTLFARYAAVPQVTRFVMGRTWRDMSPAQQGKAQDALVAYVGRVYTSLLNDYQGQTLEVTGEAGAGRGAGGIWYFFGGTGERSRPSQSRLSCPHSFWIPTIVFFKCLLTCTFSLTFSTFYPSSLCCFEMCLVLVVFVRFL